jgi:queuine tRNA-ribosyltransferase
VSAPFAFAVEERCPNSAARRATFDTPHGKVASPAFMPVGTRGTVKGIQPAELRQVGSTMILANAYHLHLRPGADVVRDLGGLHAFMGWDGPILTDSGGYQVFSQLDLATIDDDGVTLRSIVDGLPVRLTPESVMDIERDLGADVIMAFDHCPHDPLDEGAVAAATDRTHRWLERCVRRWRENGGTERGQALFGIVQGGAFEELRRASVEAVTAHDLPGYAIGGVSLGEGRTAMLRGIESAAPRLPADKPRYVMGVGMPLDFVDAVLLGADLFDCVTPTRHGRNHQAFTSHGRLNLRHAAWRRDTSPIDEQCDCAVCARHSRGYLRHLCKTNEMLAGVLLTLHNLRFFHRLMERIRAAIPDGSLRELRAEIAAIPEKSAG